MQACAPWKSCTRSAGYDAITVVQPLQGLKRISYAWRSNQYSQLNQWLESRWSLFRSRSSVTPPPNANPFRGTHSYDVSFSRLEAVQRFDAICNKLDCHKLGFTITWMRPCSVYSQLLIKIRYKKGSAGLRQCVTEDIIQRRCEPGSVAADRQGKHAKHDRWSKYSGAFPRSARVDVYSKRHRRSVLYPATDTLQCTQ